MTCREARRLAVGARCRLVLAACGVCAACVDIEPAWKAEGDAGIGITLTGIPADCEQCAAAPNTPGPGCADELRDCLADPRCMALSECVIRAGCYPPDDLQDVYACAWPCATEYEVVVYDETYELAMPLGRCIIANCAEACAYPPDD